MKTVTCWRELEPFGIDPLTGEACGLTCRILFDVTERGRKILAKTLGIPDLNLAEPWNRGTAADPHVGSLMLPHEMLTLVSVFALLESGCDEAWSYQGGVVGFEPGDTRDRRGLHLDLYRDRLVRRYAYGGTAGDRNAHQMSGRVE